MERYVRFGAEEGGATAVEYSLIAALIALAIVGSLTFVTAETVEMWAYVTDTLDEAMD